MKCDLYIKNPKLCGAFSDCSKCKNGVIEPQTNEEWLRSCTTEELAEILRKLTVDAFDDCRKNNEYWIYKDSWVEWLQEEHT